MPQRRSRPGLDINSLRFRYAIEGDNPPWRPLHAFDDGKKVYIEFPRGIAQGEMPPLFIVGPEGKTSELVNYRVRGNHMIVDRLFAAAELRLGDRQLGAPRTHRAHRRETGVVSEQERACQLADRDLAAELRLRPERPPVTRLSRKVLMGLCGGAGIVVSGALIWALYQGRGKQLGGGELYNTENKTTPDGLAALPRDYTGVSSSNTLPGVPRLGPPLPGDLGRPILKLRREGIPRA